jgi:taurine dioxygenase
MSIEERVLSQPLGVELVGIDTAEPSDLELRRIRSAVRKHHLVLLRGRPVPSRVGIRISELFGKAEVRVAHLQDQPLGQKMSESTNNNAFWNGELYFHMDGMFYDTPLRALSLYALEAVSTGGETLYANSALAYDLLPPKVKNRIARLQARNVWAEGISTGAERQNPEAYDPALHMASVHPLVATDPLSGRKALTASKMFTDRIIGISRAESDELLDELFSFMERADLRYAHKWEVDDFVVWNNRTLQHARADFDPSQRRSFRRVPVVDLEPVTVV